MQAIVRACADEHWSARVVAVIANCHDAFGLAFAQAQGIPTLVVESRGKTRELFESELAVVIDAFSPNLVVLAGFMRVLTSDFTLHYAGRLMNIHPSLLPAFPGLHTHASAIEAGCKLSGATVHFVTSVLDHGPIVLQAAVPIKVDDTPETLSDRILAVEHVIYPRAVRWFVEDRLYVDDLYVSLAPDINGMNEPQWFFGANA